MTNWSILQVARPGDIIHVRTYSSFGKLIRWALTKWLTRLCHQQLQVPPKDGVWGNHDGIIVRNPDTGLLMVGESKPGGTCMTDLSDYVLDQQSGKLHFRLLRPTVDVATEAECEQAAQNWLANELGKPYDYGAYPRLLFKALVGDWINRVAGWEFANWCTQGVHNAYITPPPGVNLMQTTNPTPLTVEQVGGWVPLRFGRRRTLQEVK